jgi:23S rRNA pseudouridine1911/1915/1917 synthase
VHLAGIGFPVVADEFYSPASVLSVNDVVGSSSSNGHAQGNGSHPLPPADEILMTRQALHARSLRFVHPITREVVTFEAPLAADMQRTLDVLRAER